MRVLALLLLLLLPLAAQAQSEAEERDRDLLTALLEDSLSDAGRQVQIDGFAGALSSRATVETLSISDADGEWLRAEGLTLDWDRSALLRGALIVREISAQSLTLTRLPPSGGPSAEASTGFALPDLPVSVEIGALNAPRITLGAAVLGEEVVAALTGRAALADGSGSGVLALIRRDGAMAELSLEAGFEAESRALSLDFALREAAGGLVGDALGLPGAPALDLTVAGRGPLEDFTADIRLSTDDTPRLNGAVTLRNAPLPEGQAGPAPQLFSATLNGDMTPLFLSEYREFFGPDVALDLSGQRSPEGAIEISALSLSARALTLSASGALAADGLPERFALSGQLAAPDDAPGDTTVLLPLAGPPTRIARASISAGYEAGQSDGFSALAVIDGLSRDGVSVEAATLGVEGRIRRIGQARQVDADLAFSAVGLLSDDAALAEALGPEARGAARLSWVDGAPLQLQRLTLDSGQTSAQAAGQIGGLETGYRLIGQAEVQSAEFARFGALLGQPISGAGALSLTGWGAPLGGAFDLSLNGVGRDLGIGIEPLDALLAGAAELAVSARRDGDGLTLRQARIDTPALAASASGQISSAASELALSARLDSMDRLVSGFAGALSLEGQAGRADGRAPWTLALTAEGPGGLRADLSGTALDSAAMDLHLRGAAPLGLLNGLTDAMAAQGDLAFDLGLGGASLAALSGQISTSGAALSVPQMALSLDDVDASATLSGGQAQVTGRAASRAGGTLDLGGSVGLSGGFPAALSLDLAAIGLTDGQAYDTTVSGALTLSGPLVSGPALSGAISLGPTELRIAPTTVGAGGEIPDIRHIGASAAVRQTQAAAGVAATDGARAGAPIALDLSIDAPGRIFIRGRGLDAELGGRLRITGSSADIIPIGQFSLLRGRLDILGKRLALEEGQLLLEGALDPAVRLVAATDTGDGITVRIVIEGSLSEPRVSFTSDPELPEDEVLARLLFGTNISEMSALQAAQLASAVATLTGGGGGIVDKLRASFGLDDLDLTSDEDGNAALRVGKYLSENVYTDVVVDSTGRSQINLNLDVGNSVTITGGLDNEGNTGIGIFFEKDY